MTKAANKDRERTGLELSNKGNWGKMFQNLTTKVIERTKKGLVELNNESSLHRERKRKGFELNNNLVRKKVQMGQKYFLDQIMKK